LRGDAYGGGIEQFCDPEIEQHGRSFGSDEDVAGLEIAMDDEALVRVVYRYASLHEEAQAAGDAEFVLVAVAVDGNAVDIIDHQVRQPIVGGPAVDQAQDMGMIEGREFCRSMTKRRTTSGLAMPGRMSLMATRWRN